MISAVRARIPPSPWLSARITSARYLTQMITTNAQNASDATPERIDSGRNEVVVLEGLPDRVQRAGADIAEHDTESAERQSPGADMCEVSAPGRISVLA